MVDLVKPWIAFLKPWEEVKETKGSILEGIIYAEISLLYYFLAGVLVLWLFGGGTGGTIAVIIFTLFYFLGIMVTPILLLIFSGIDYIIARLFGGKGSFELQTFRFGYFGYPLAILFYLFYLLYLISKINLLAGLYILIILWSSVINFFIIKETHQLSGLRAAAVTTILVVIGILFGILLHYD
jgi:hypothetical protein